MKLSNLILTKICRVFGYDKKRGYIIDIKKSVLANGDCTINNIWIITSVDIINLFLFVLKRL